MSGIGSDRKRPKLSAVAYDDSARVHDELQRASARFAEFVRDAGLAALTLDVEGRITYCNDHVLDVTGRTREQLVGTTWHRLIRQRPQEDAQPRFDALLRGATASWQHEDDLVDRNGEPVPIRWHHSVIRSVSSQVIGIASLGERLGAAPAAHIATDAPVPHDHRLATAAEIVAVADRLRVDPDHASLAFLRLVADQCAQLAEECGEATSGAAIARYIRQMFRV